MADLYKDITSLYENAVFQIYRATISSMVSVAAIDMDNDHQLGAKLLSAAPFRPTSHPSTFSTYYQQCPTHYILGVFPFVSRSLHKPCLVGLT